MSEHTQWYVGDNPQDYGNGIYDGEGRHIADVYWKDDADLPRAQGLARDIVQTVNAYPRLVDFVKTTAAIYHCLFDQCICQGGLDRHCIGAEARDLLKELKL